MNAGAEPNSLVLPPLTSSWTNVSCTITRNNSSIVEFQVGGSILNVSISQCGTLMMNNCEWDRFQRSTPIACGALAYGNGFVLNTISRISGTISSTSGIAWFLRSDNISTYQLGLSFNATYSMPASGFIYTTGNVTSANANLVLSVGKYGLMILDRFSVPSNITSDSHLVATPFP